MQVHYKLAVVLMLIGATSWGFGDVDFDRSNGFDNMQQYSAEYEDPDASHKISLLRSNYQRLKPSKAPSQPQSIIPKIIHQIWPGNDPIPKNYQYFLETWRKYHPDWQIKIWTEKDLIKENFSTIDLYWQARSYQERADIMRYEVLKKYGGLYIDMDIECFASFDVLHHKYDFYTNTEPPAVNKKRVSIVNAMIASVPNHPILTQTLAYLRQNWYTVEDMFEQQYGSSWRSFARSTHHLAVQRTMYPFSDAIFDFLQHTDQSNYRSIILPAGYNVPIYFINEAPVINFLSRVFRGKAKLGNQIMFQPETMSFHYYDKENSLMTKYNFAESLFNRNLVKGKFYSLLQFRNKYYLAFENLFNKNFPTDIKYQSHAKIPKIIYLEQDDDISPEELGILVDQWYKINPSFIVKTLNSQELASYLPQKFHSQDALNKSLLARFYLLRKNGGIFVDLTFKPTALSEFNYKYDFYGQFAHLNNLKEEMSIDTAIIAAEKHHSILSNFLRDIENNVAQDNQLTIVQIKSLLLENTYKYHQVDGINIIFPELYFKQKQ